MKLINKDADYAIKALVEIAGRGGEVVSAAGLTRPLGLPWPYLRKILQTLAKAGLVRSSRGPRGGFVLAQQAGTIRLTDVIGVFQGRVRIHDCLFKPRRCPDVQTCPLRKTLDRLESRLVDELKAVTVADLLDERAQPGRARMKGR
jgi:Rrf2 family protein